MKRVILTPNPYRDKNFQTVRKAAEILKDAGIESRICLPFDVDRSFELPKDLRFSRLERELGTADAIICFGGDGTILHIAKTATRHDLPVLGVNIGTMGFMAELESGELAELARLANDDFTLDERMMLDATVYRDRDIVFHDICLNDVAITKGAIARVVHLGIKCDGVQAMECGGDGVVLATPTGTSKASQKHTSQQRNACRVSFALAKSARLAHFLGAEAASMGSGRPTYTRQPADSS